MRLCFTLLFTKQKVNCHSAMDTANTRVPITLITDLVTVSNNVRTTKAAIGLWIFMPLKGCGFPGGLLSFMYPYLLCCDFVLFYLYLICLHIYLLLLCVESNCLL